MSAGMTRIVRGLTVVDSGVGLVVDKETVGSVVAGVGVDRPGMVQAASKMSRKMEAMRIRTASLR